MGRRTLNSTLHHNLLRIRKFSTGFCCLKFGGKVVRMHLRDFLVLAAAIMSVVALSEAKDKSKKFVYEREFTPDNNQFWENNVVNAKRKYLELTTFNRKPKGPGKSKPNTWM